MLIFIAILAVGVLIWAIALNVVTASENEKFVSGALYKSPKTYQEEKDFLTSIIGKPVKSKELCYSSMDRAISILAKHPNDDAICHYFLDYARKTFLLPPKRQQRERLYRGVLSILAHSEIDLSATSRMFVLDLARWYYASIREDKRLTSYDEQAIQNDISTLFGK